MSKVVVEAADMITAGDVETDLYIDFNGGSRDVAFMIYSLANLMKLQNVTIRQILTINYENPKKETIQGVEMQLPEIRPDLLLLYHETRAIDDIMDLQQPMHSAWRVREFVFVKSPCGAYAHGAGAPTIESFRAQIVRLLCRVWRTGCRWRV